MDKPTFNTALGAFELTQQTKPPVRFDGVTTRVFPLKANMHRLSAFCDAYLNLAPEVAYFRPALPYVYLMVIDYGKMSAEVANLGWVAQHEIAFAVPLEWYRVEGGRRVFADWASVCPFIFVDNEMSLSTGREVYGWPKVKVCLDAEVGPWISNPNTSQPLLSVSTMLFPELYAGQRQQPEVFLQVRQRPAPWTLRVPPDLTSGFDPLRFASRAVTGYLNLLGQLAEVASALPLMGYERGPLPPAWLTLLRRGPRYLDGLSAPPALNNITLKQFRDAEKPGRICYQAIVNSAMRVKRFNGGGMVGDANLLLGDPSGGIDILLRRSPAQPIIESLGIDVGRADEFAASGMSRVQPVLPFWLDFDLEYGTGAALCWRARNSTWHTGPAAVAEPATRSHHFNTIRGVEAQDITGPFEFPNTTLRVLPLLADPAKLERLCDDYLGAGLGDDCPYTVKAWGSYVYLVVTNFGEMSSKTNNIGWWAERELTFFVPVQVWDRKENTLLSVALVQAFAFADTETAAIVGREVSGRPTATAAITSPPNAWMSDSGPTWENEALMSLETLMLPALHLGQRAEWRRLLDVTHQDTLPYTDVVGWRRIADDWIRPLKDEVKRKWTIATANQDAFGHARDLAVGVLAGRLPISLLTLKQFRDVSDPDCACYQALVRCGRVIEHVYDIREIEERVHLRIRRNPALAIADRLGLQIKHTETTGTAVVDIIQPVRPFWARLSLREDLGENLAWRTGVQWQRDERRQPRDLFYFEAQEPTGVVDGIGELADFREQRLKELLLQLAPAESQVIQMPSLSREQARAAVAAIEPQLVIESILSREWENWGNPRFYQQVLRERSRASGAPPVADNPKPFFCIPCHSLGEGQARQDAFKANDAAAWWYVKDSGEGGCWVWT